MCLNPILIKNVNYGNTSKLAYIKDTTSQFIPVPCGRCSVCLALKQQYIVQRVQMESLSNELFFGTLTYNDECVPHVKSGEFDLLYPDIRDWQCMIKMIRKHESLPKFKYLLVSEYGGKRHRPHFHFILSFPRNDSDSLALKRSFATRLYDIFLRYWRRNVGSTRTPVWRNLCTFKYTSKSYNYDLHYLDPWSSANGLDDIAFYVTKYCLKFDPWIDKLKSKLFFNLPEDDFKIVWDKLRPRRLISKNFGSIRDPKVVEHINKGIHLSLCDSNALFPYFISPVNGKTFPLSPYYSQRFLTIPQLELFNSRKMTLTDYDMMTSSQSKLTVDQIKEKERKFKVVCESLASTTTRFDDDTLLSNLYIYGNSSETPFICQDSSFSWEDSDFADCFDD